MALRAEIIGFGGGTESIGEKPRKMTLRLPDPYRVRWRDGRPAFQQVVKDGSQIAGRFWYGRERRVQTLFLL